jgi:hypothetical protein
MEIHLGSSAVNTSIESEFDRQQRVLDQMLTQHSVLRDRYDRFASILDVGGIVLSAVLTAFSLMKDDYWRVLAMTPDAGTFAAGVLAAALLGLSIVQYRVQWKEKAEAHGRAARSLSAWKAEARLVSTDDAQGVVTWLRAVHGQLSTLPSIPDAMFLKLKGIHLRKEQVSRRLTSYPGGTPWLVSLRIRFAADIAQLRGSNDNG